MNAYELANELKDACIEFVGDVWVSTFEQSATMLCQQADRIAELKKNSDFWKSQYEQMCRDYQYYKELHDKELKRQADEKKASEERAKYGIY